jgi:anti-sigma factor RsiW
MSDRDGGKPSGRDAELLTAYVDGAAELPPDERQRIAALIEQDPAARTDEAALRSLLGSLRALPPDGVEPDWAAMARSVHDAVGQHVPRPWWRRWRWLVPVTACAATAVILAMWPRLWTSAVPSHEPAPVADKAPVSIERRDDIVALWLDGAQVDVDLSAADLLGDLGDEDPRDDDAASVGGLLPASNLAWVDTLDDDALARVERWLDAPDVVDPSIPAPAQPASPASPASPARPARKKG